MELNFKEAEGSINGYKKKKAPFCTNHNLAHIGQDLPTGRLISNQSDFSGGPRSLMSRKAHITENDNHEPGSNSFRQQTAKLLYS